MYALQFFVQFKSEPKHDKAVLCGCNFITNILCYFVLLQLIYTERKMNSIIQFVQLFIQGYPVSHYCSVKLQRHIGIYQIVLLIIKNKSTKSTHTFSCKLNSLFPSYVTMICQFVMFRELELNLIIFSILDFIYSSTR